MTVLEYDIGDLPRLTFEFRDVDDALADPSSVTATVRDPSGNLTNYVVASGQIVKDSTGVYHLDVDADEAGDWYYRGVGTGAISATVEGTFHVRSRRADTDGPGRVLCTVVDVLRYAPGYDPDNDTDSERLFDILWSLIAAESRSCMERLGREVVAIPPADATRRFDITRWHERHRRVQIGDATDITEVVIIDRDQATEVETVATTDYVTIPRVREEWEPIRTLWFPTGTPSAPLLQCGQVLEVTATWGWPSVPDELRSAVARMVLVRYVNDVPAGISTAFTLSAEDVNIGGMFASAREVYALHTRRPAVA